MNAVCTRSGFACEISDAATAVLRNRTQQLHNGDIRLSLLLDGLCTPFGLTWIRQEGVIRIRAATELDAGDLADYQRAAGKRLLRNALVVAPDSHHSSYSRVSLGIPQFQEQMFVDAAHSFHLQGQLDPRSDVQAETAFNLGKCFLAMGQIDDARVAFRQTMDASSNNLDAHVGEYLYVGRLQLEQGEFSGAVSSLVRALAVSRGTDLEQPAALIISTAYLIAGKPQGANSILMAGRENLQDSEYREAEYVVATTLIRKMSALNDVSSDRARSGMVSLQQSLVRISQLGENVAQATQSCERDGLARSAKLSAALDDQTKNLQVSLDQIDSVKEFFSGVRDRILPQLDGDVTRRTMHQAYQRTMKTG